MSQPAVPGDKPESIGRDDSNGNLGDAATKSKHHWPPTAGVVIRASVEHVGLVGETELTVNVKWPASTFCAQPPVKPAHPSDHSADSQNVPANGPDASNFDTLYGEATADPKPLTTDTSGSS